MFEGSLDTLPVWETELYRQAVCDFPSMTINCRLAMTEMRMSLARLIWQFDMELAEGQDEPLYDHISISATKLVVKIANAKK